MLANASHDLFLCVFFDFRSQGLSSGPLIAFFPLRQEMALQVVSLLKLVYQWHSRDTTGTDATWMGISSRKGGLGDRNTPGAPYCSCVTYPFLSCCSGRSTHMKERLSKSLKLNESFFKSASSGLLERDLKGDKSSVAFLSSKNDLV